MEGGVLPPFEPRCSGRMLQRKRGPALPPALLSPINCHFQDYQSAGLGGGWGSLQFGRNP